MTPRIPWPTLSLALLLATAGAWACGCEADQAVPAAAVSTAAVPEQPSTPTSQADSSPDVSAVAKQLPRDTADADTLAVCTELVRAWRELHANLPTARAGQPVTEDLPEENLDAETPTEARPSEDFTRIVTRLITACEAYERLPADAQPWPEAVVRWLHVEALLQMRDGEEASATQTLMQQALALFAQSAVPTPVFDPVVAQLGVQAHALLLARLDDLSQSEARNLLASMTGWDAYLEPLWRQRVFPEPLAGEAMPSFRVRDFWSREVASDVQHGAGSPDRVGLRGVPVLFLFTASWQETVLRALPTVYETLGAAPNPPVVVHVLCDDPVPDAAAWAGLFAPFDLPLPTDRETPPSVMALVETLWVWDARAEVEASLRHAFRVESLPQAVWVTPAGIIAWADAFAPTALTEPSWLLPAE